MDSFRIVVVVVIIVPDLGDVGAVHVGLDVKSS